MRIYLLSLVLLAGTAVPALAQPERVDRRVEKLESEMRAVQRKIFPGGRGATVEPEITAAASTAPAAGVPASSAVADLTARVDALEAQIAAITGQSEQNAFRVRQLEEALNQFRASTEARFASAPPASGPQPAVAEPVAQAAPEARVQNASAVAIPSSGDAGEDAYLNGFRLWETGRLADSQAALEAMAKAHPRHRRASYALNLAGRAYLDDGKAATAAKLLLQNYQTNPKGERAADSLLFLGEALTKLNKPAEACQVYAELQDVYGPNMRDFVKQRLPKARSEAKCGG